MSDCIGDLVFKATLKNGMYYIYPKIPGPSNRKVTFKALSVERKKDINIWHGRLGHLVRQSLYISLRKME